MRTAGWARLAAVVALVVAAGGGRAQDGSRALGSRVAAAGVEPATVTAATTTDAGPATIEDALRGMEQQAAVIFAGQVAAVRRRPGTNGATGVVEIDFAVDDAVRGVGGGTYTLREWAGLWPAGEQRFRVGERYLMLLHAPSAAGLSSPVGGVDGAIPIRGGAATAMLAAARAAAISANAQGTGTAGLAVGAADVDARVVDLRWIATGVVRPVAYRPESPVHTTTVVRAEMTAGLSAAPLAPSETTAAVSAGLNLPLASAAGTAQGAGYATVLGLLRSWVKSDAAAR